MVLIQFAYDVYYRFLGNVGTVLLLYGHDTTLLAEPDLDKDVGNTYRDVVDCNRVKSLTEGVIGSQEVCITVWTSARIVSTITSPSRIIALELIDVAEPLRNGKLMALMQ